VSTTPKKNHDPATAFAAEAAQRKSAYDEAKAAHEAATQFHAEAVTTLAAAIDSDTSTGDELLRAEADLRVAQARKDRSAEKLALAERRLVNTDVSLAEALVPLVSDAVGITATAQPFTPPTPLDVPSLVIVQKKPATLSRSGALAGEVEVVYYRRKLYSPLTPATLGGHRGITANPGSTIELEGGVLVDTIRIVASQVMPALPVIEPGREARGMANLSAELNARVADKLSGVALDSTTRAVVADSLSAGTRRMTVELVVLGYPTKVGSSVSSWGDRINHSTGLDSIEQQIEQAALSFDGKAVEGLGRIASVEIKSASLIEHAGTARPSNKVAFTGSTTSGVLVDGIAVRLHAVIVSAVPEGAKLPQIEGSRPSLPPQRTAPRGKAKRDEDVLAVREAGARKHPGVRA
jgi:hypothetical protein